MSKVDKVTASRLLAKKTYSVLYTNSDRIASSPEVFSSLGPAEFYEMTFLIGHSGN